MAQLITNSTLPHYRGVITESWNKTVVSLLETSSLLVEAENTLSPTDWEELKNYLPFGDSVRSMLSGIGRSKRFGRKNIQKLLPANYTTIYEYSTFDDDEWDKAITDGVVDTDMSTEAVRRWKQTLRLGIPSSKTTTSPSSINQGYFAAIPSIDDLNGATQQKVKTLIDNLDNKLKPLGLGVVYQSNTGTVRNQHIQDQKDKLTKRLETELAKELSGFAKVPQKQLDEIESAYYQFRYHQHQGKYPYPINATESIQRKKHTYSISKMDFPTFMSLIRENKIITSWTPIRSYGDAGRAKCIKLALEHTNAKNTNQRSNYKRQLKSIASRKSVNSGFATTYLDMLVE